MFSQFVFAVGRSRLVMSGISLAIAVLPTAPAAGQCTFDWRTGHGLPGTDGPVYALTTWDPDGPGPEPEQLVIGGEFSIAGDLFANNIATWNGVNWQPLGTGIAGSDCCPSVKTLAVYNGELIAGGNFSIAGGVSVNRIARWDGETWQPLGAGVSASPYTGHVDALAVYNGELIAGGFFHTAGGISANNIARWNGAIWQPLGTGVESPNCCASVHALTLYEGALIVGGSFTTAGGVTVQSIARWDGTNWQALAGGLSGQVAALAAYNGDLVAGGDFHLNGNLHGILRWNDTNWQPMDDGLASHVGRTLTTFNGELIEAGYSNCCDGTDPDHVYRWDGETWQPLGELQAAVNVLGSYAGELIAGTGYYVSEFLARWNGTVWRPLGQGLNGSVSALLPHGDDLVAGGHFSWADNLNVKGVSRWDGLTWQPLGSGMSGVAPYFEAWVNALAAYNNELIAGGFFSFAGGVSANNIARWDGSAWHALGSGVAGSPTAAANVNALAVFDGELIAAGSFETAGGVSANNIARWDGASWQPLGGGISAPPFSARVYALTVYNGELIVGGVFQTAGGVSANNIARWNGATWAPLGSGIGNNPFSSFVWGLSVYNDELIATGQFMVAGGLSASGIARWNGLTWASLGAGLSFSARSLTVYAGELVVGGGFTQAGGAPANRIARWNGSAWQPLGNGLHSLTYPNAEAMVLALTAYQGELVAGGHFTIADGQISGYWARWGPTCPPADLNCDQAVTPADIAPFVNALLEPSSIDNCLTIVADVNHDGAIDALDIHEFTACVVAGGCS